MDCPQCGHDNVSSAKFCSDCGARLQVVCPQCGAASASTARFCAECGAALGSTVAAAPASGPPSLEAQFGILQEALPVSFQQRLLTPAEGENRIVTVLFADMSDSVETTRNLPPDEAADLVNRLLQAMVDRLLKYEGRIDKLLGDGVLAVFGVPQAHESDPERAIMAALEICEAARELGLSATAGINTGEVYVGGVGSERHREVTVMGPVVNLAARLQDKAEAGEILVGAPTYRQTRRAFEFAPLVLEIRGIAEPVTAYRVQRPLPHPEKARGIEGLRAPLTGRNKELALLRECAEALVQERKGQIVSLVGEAGIGKTRLVSELKEHLVGGGVEWLEGRCISIGQSASFWPFIDMMRTYLGISGDDSDAEMAGKLIRTMTDLFPHDTGAVVPYLARMLSINVDERYQERIRYAAPEQIRRQTLLRMRDFFVTLARRQPLVVLLEDLHWADDLSLDLLWVLMDELAAAPILLVCLYRPEREHSCWKIDSAASSKHRERYTPISLKPLTPNESRQLVHSLLDVEELPAATRSAILESTEGNPFFLEEVVRLLIERGVLYLEEGRWQAREMAGEVTVPDTIRSVILSRIDRLPAELRSVLQCAAVIGRVFPRRLLEYLSEPDQALETHLSQLEAHELIYLERIVLEMEYAFKHALTQETAYEGIITRHRRVFHERVGNAIETLYPDQIEEYSEVLAFHYGRSANENKAIEYLVKAAQKAAARYANEAALGYLDKALERTHGSDEYDSILALRAKFFLSLFRGREATGDYEQLLQSAKETGHREQELASLLGLAAASYSMALDEAGFATRSRDLYRQAYDLAREMNDKAGMARALIPTTWFIDFWPEYRDEAAANVEEALALSQEVGEEALILDSLQAQLNLSRMLARHEAAEGQGEALLQRLLPRHDLLRINDVYYQLMWTHLARGNLERCIECCEAGTRVAAEMGLPPVQYPTLKAHALMGLGRYGEAWTSLQEEVADEAHPFGRAVRDLGIGQYLVEMGAYERAAGVLKDVIEQARHVGRAWIERGARTHLARSLLRLAAQDGTPPAETAQRLQQVDAALPASIPVELALAEERLDEALRLAGKAVTRARETGRRRELLAQLELKLRVLLRLGRPEEVVALAEEGLRIAEERNLLPMEWRIRAARAQALEAAGSGDAAAREYQAAAAMLRRLADTISDAGLRETFLADPQVASILAAPHRRVRGKEE